MSPHGSTRVVAPPQLHNRRGHQPSFSAALLDAIYHSLEADARSPSGAGRTAPASPAQLRPVSSRRHRPTTPSLSRSGSCSSSTRSPRLQRTPRPCRVRPDPHPNSLLLPPPPPPHEPATACHHRSAEKTKACRKSRKTKTKTTKVAPIACLLNALLCNRNSANKSAPNTPRAAAPAPAAAAGMEPPASARSILSSRASRRESAATGGGVLTPARRAVRFSPVAVVVDDEHGRGIGTATRLRDAEMEVVCVKESAAEAERRVEELLRALGVAEERDRDRAKESSESSSDLFELDGFPPALEDAAEMPRLRLRAAGAGAGLERPRPRV